MYSNEYFGINTNQDILKDTADLFPETYQTVNEYGKSGVNEYARTGVNEYAKSGVNEYARTGVNEYAKSGVTFQNFTTTTNVAQPQTIITYQTENLQPINQDIHESLEPQIDPLTFIDQNTVFTGTQGNAEATFETGTQEINPPSAPFQTTYEYIQPQTNYQNINLPPQNLNQIITYTENPVNEFVQYDTALQTQPINETITINKTTQAPIIETKVLPSQIIQSPPTIEAVTYEYSQPIVENVTLPNIEQTQNVDLGGQYEEVSQVPEPPSYSLVPQPIITPPPKPKKTVIVKVPKIQKVIVPKIQKVIVPSNKKIIVRRPPGVGVSTIQTIPQPVPAAVPATISSSTVRVPYSTASIQTPVVTQVPVPMTSTVRVPPPVPVPATIPYSTGSVKAVTTTMPIASTQTVAVPVASPTVPVPATIPYSAASVRVPYSVASVRVPYSVASVKVPATTPTVAVPVASPTVPVPATIPYSASSVRVPYSVASVKAPATTPTVGVPIATPPVPVPATIPYSATSVKVPYSVASVKVPVTTPVPVATPRPLPVAAVPTPVPAAVGIAPILTSSIRPTLPVPSRPPAVPVPRPLPVAAVPVRPVVTQTLPYSTLSQRPLVANAAQPLPVAAVPPRPLVVPQAANLGMARPAIYNASTYNASTIRPVGRTIPMTTGVVPVPVNNNKIGNMAFQGKYTTRTYNARKL